MVTCMHCKKLVINCDLEDTLDGFSEGKYYPLRVCLKCLDISDYKFVSCKACSALKNSCVKWHSDLSCVPIEPKLFQFLTQIKYFCKYCVDSVKYTPRELREHLINDCDGFINELKTQRSNINFKIQDNKVTLDKNHWCE